jgi:hypothetical protein
MFDAEISSPLTIYDSVPRKVVQGRLAARRTLCESGLRLAPNREWLCVLLFPEAARSAGDRCAAVGSDLISCGHAFGADILSRLTQAVMRLDWNTAINSA